MKKRFYAFIALNLIFLCHICHPFDIMLHVLSSRVDFLWVHQTNFCKILQHFEAEPEQNNFTLIERYTHHLFSFMRHSFMNFVLIKLKRNLNYLVVIFAMSTLSV